MVMPDLNGREALGAIEAQPIECHTIIYLDYLQLFCLNKVIDIHLVSHHLPQPLKKTW